MEWIFVKVYKDGYYNEAVLDEYGNRVLDEYGNAVKVQKYGAQLAGYYGTGYSDGYMGDPNYILTNEFIIKNQYNKLKQSLPNLNLNKGADDKSKAWRAKSYAKLLEQMVAIEEIDK